MFFFACSLFSDSFCYRCWSSAGHLIQRCTMIVFPLRYHFFSSPCCQCKFNSSFKLSSLITTQKKYTVDGNWWFEEIVFFIFCSNFSVFSRADGRLLWVGGNLGLNFQFHHFCYSCKENCWFMWTWNKDWLELPSRTWLFSRPSIWTFSICSVTNLTLRLK